MSKRNEKNRASTTHGVSYTETASGVTLTIEGAAFENLKEITSIFNAWDGTEHTPAEMIWRECFAASEMLMRLGEKKPDACVGETLPSVLCDNFREAPDVGELAEAFQAVGFNIEI